MDICKKGCKPAANVKIDYPLKELYNKIIDCTKSIGTMREEGAKTG
jgi:hypothetical protein